jgi:hypothetical protein
MDDCRKMTAGGPHAARRPWRGLAGYCPAFPPGQILVKERMLSGYVLKIGSPKWLDGELKQWKYLVL